MMGLKKITPRKLTCCPACGGGKGYAFTRKAHNQYRGLWGSVRGAVRQRTKEVTRNIKTVVCLDCKKRFELT